MNTNSAQPLPPPFDVDSHKPIDDMSYADRVAVWKEYCVFRKLSNDFKVYSDRETFKYVESQLNIIKTNFLDHFTSTSLIDPQYL